MAQQDVGVVVIGRNEGERLRLCLQSLGGVAHRVYVDSGSTDGSQALARRMGFEVVELAQPPGFTAARARNAGLARLLESNPRLAFVQMVDGDCEVVPGWIDGALAALAGDDRLAAVFGRRRERYPRASIYNMMCDDEWNVPVGPARSCGGDVMFRVAALVEADGYSADLIAGEEPDLCLRLRRRGWTFERIAPEMTIHDVALHRLGQWWRRTRRAGYAFAELSARHGTNADPSWRRHLVSISVWAGVILATLALLAVGLVLGVPAAAWMAAALALLVLVQIVRLTVAKARGMSARDAFTWAYLIMLAKVAQFQGMMQFYLGRLRGRRSGLIEYKS